MYENEKLSITLFSYSDVEIKALLLGNIEDLAEQIATREDVCVNTLNATPDEVDEVLRKYKEEIDEKGLDALPVELFDVAKQLYIDFLTYTDDPLGVNIDIRDDFILCFSEMNRDLFPDDIEKISLSMILENCPSMVEKCKYENKGRFAIRHFIVTALNLLHLTHIRVHKKYNGGSCMIDFSDVFGELGKYIKPPSSKEGEERDHYLIDLSAENGGISHFVLNTFKNKNLESLCFGMDIKVKRKVPTEQ